MSNKQTLNQELTEEAVDSRYDELVVEALQQQRPDKVFELKWGRVFLTQKLGFWVG